MLQNQTSIWNAKNDNLATVTIDSTIYDTPLHFVTKTLAPASVRAFTLFLISLSFIHGACLASVRDAQVRRARGLPNIIQGAAM